MRSKAFRADAALRSGVRRFLTTWIFDVELIALWTRGQGGFAGGHDHRCRCGDGRRYWLEAQASFLKPSWTQSGPENLSSPTRGEPREVNTEAKVGMGSLK